MNLRYPDINGATPSEQIRQISSFLRQLVDNINVSNSTTTVTYRSDSYTPSQGKISSPVASSSGTNKTPLQQFNDIKGLIIKSADIIDAYYEEMSKSFSSKYVAQSEFGDYQETTNTTITANAEKLVLLQESIAQTIAQTEDGSSVRVQHANAWVNIGKVETNEDGVDIYGIAVGQTTTLNGEEIYKRYATYTTAGVTLYDNKGNATARLVDGELVSARVSVSDSIKIGGYRETVGSDGSIIDRWEGYNGWQAE